MAGVSGLVDNYGGFLITLAMSLLVGYIRLEEHRKNMKLKDLEIRAKEQELNGHHGGQES